MAKKENTLTQDGRVILAPTSADFLIRDPQTFEPLPIEGASKILNSYWDKRILEGSVKIINNGEK